MDGMTLIVLHRFHATELFTGEHAVYIYTHYYKRMCVCVCVCVRERGGGGEREKKKRREKAREIEAGIKSFWRQRLLSALA